ncbi:MAG: thiamine pyrophosphate-dependent enzyme [Acidobacteriota bacterium]
MNYLDESMALPFCPGCGHSHILPVIDEALRQLELDPRMVVLVSDIGCVGLSDQHFTTSAMHGLHGRSFTYATGMKLANPELEVIVLIGDGGCGIGAAHLVHAARRNIGIKVIVFNNFNFGMTGGQHSVTTPAGSLTATSKQGHLEAPLDICGTIAPSRPAFVARTSTYDPDFADLMTQAIAADGFALLDIWELCSAYFGPANRLNRKKMTGWMEELQMPPGILSNGDRPEYAKALWAQGNGAEAAAKAGNGGIPGFEPRFQSSLAAKISIFLAGNAGQRVQSAGDVLARAAVGSRLFATQKGSYPVTIKTGYSLAELVLSPQPIGCSDGGTPDFAVATGVDGVQMSRARLASMGPESLVIVDDPLPEFETGAEVRRLALSEAAKSIDRAGLVSVGLGVLLSTAKLLPQEALEWAAEQRFGAQIAEKVVACMRAGFELGTGG